MPFGYKAGKEQWDKESYEVVGRRTIGMSGGGQMYARAIVSPGEVLGRSGEGRSRRVAAFLRGRGSRRRGRPMGLVHVRKGS